MQDYLKKNIPVDHSTNLLNLNLVWRGAAGRCVHTCILSSLARVLGLEVFAKMSDVFAENVKM